MVTLLQQQDGGYMLLWKRYVNNKMAAMRFLHLQQYSHRLNLLYVFFIPLCNIFISILTTSSHILRLCCSCRQVSKIGICVHLDTMKIIYQYLLSCRNVIRFHGTHVIIIWFTAIRKVFFSICRFYETYKCLP